ncbi:MAG TPA: hypothetical protein VIG44_07355, partial [Thermomicrobiales bacterium]
MHNGVNAIQFDAKPRTGRLPKLCTERMQKALDVTPTDLCWCRSTEYQFEGLSLLRVHTRTISKGDSKVKITSSCIPCLLERRMPLHIEIRVNQRAAEAV